ncbi:leucine-rich repeat, immunoglobulin-like domain and transmembrane domain-containing protein 3b [Syngnathus acus]|uniref:leucine-rich repeat, immunoglobulin-like domain and transmembrane domain-containing protein 3b n=1 Tax=Syngnathus acus TaxID=161584 RepID=UPI001885B55F|nr:leucine-rich repeat, immunoglobulin-like domain and transmembrane domain-containing protein 3b [Syngnathus acus]
MYLLLFLHVLLYHLSAALDSCPLLCACVYGTREEADLRSVQCSDSGISAVPLDIPADTVKLRLEKTLISRVPRAAFFNLSELLFLWLTYNSITSIHPSSFVNLRALRELRLDGNLLSAFPWEGLRDMPGLQTLGLHNNRIASLPSHAAVFLPNITYLDLSSNRLTTLSAQMLDLWFPLLGQRGKSVPRRILGLHDNPWLCDCQISLMASLSMSPGSPVVLMDQLLTCSASPGAPSGIPLSKAQLPRCSRPSVRPAAARVVSLLGSHVILRCDATGYPTPTLTWLKTSNYAGCCRRDVADDIRAMPSNLKSCKMYLPFHFHLYNPAKAAYVAIVPSAIAFPSYHVALISIPLLKKPAGFAVLAMQGSPGVGVRWSIISLDDLALKDAGEYRCRARNVAGISEAPVELKVVAAAQLSRLPRKESRKTPPEPKWSSNGRKFKPNQSASLRPRLKDKPFPRAATQKNHTQTFAVIVSQSVPVYHKGRKAIFKKMSPKKPPRLSDLTIRHSLCQSQKYDNCSSRRLSV